VETTLADVPAERFWAAKRKIEIEIQPLFSITLEPAFIRPTSASFEISTF
jgi:hypothetical protein